MRQKTDAECLLELRATMSELGQSRVQCPHCIAIARAMNGQPVDDQR